jgi:transcriptional regulator with XRE-family HTH domain
MIPMQCRLGRTALEWGVRDLARHAKVSPNTVARLERGETMQEETIAKLRATLEAAGVEFIDQNGGGAGVRLVRPRPPKAKAKASEKRAKR